MYDDQDSGSHAFYPSCWAGDTAGLSMDSGFAIDPFAGTSCVRITFSPTHGASDNWASVSWTYPDKNWGERPGRSLPGATRLRGWIAGQGNVTLKIGGMNWPPENDPRNPYQDVFRREKTLELTQGWTQFDLPIPTKRTDQVIAGLTVGFTTPATVYLDEVAYDDVAPLARNKLRLVRSFVPTSASEDAPIRSAAHLYDNALLAIAMLSASGPKTPYSLKSPEQQDLQQRAYSVLDAICWAQQHDRQYKDGRLRNVYSAGLLKDWATSTARLPGSWDPLLKQMLEDKYSVSSDVGGMSWACLALLTGAESSLNKNAADVDPARRREFVKCASSDRRMD